jgi:ribosome-associated toxin RatA of RatAB toxin-antitoxin module
MAALVHEHVFDGDIQKVFKGICQFDQYSEHLPGVTGIQVLDATQKDSVCRVRYELKIIKEFYYTLHMFIKEPEKIFWQLDESNVLITNNGSWTLSAKSKKKTTAVYSLDVSFKGLVPKMLTDKIAAANLPNMFAGFQKIIDSV